MFYFRGCKIIKKIREKRTLHEIFLKKEGFMMNFRKKAWSVTSFSLTLQTTHIST